MICFLCKKRKIILLTCKCENKFCIKHNSPEDHNCTVINELFKIEITDAPKKIEKI